MDTHDTSVLFSKKSDDWETPSDLFQTLDREFAFQLDVCASKENAKCETFITAEQDALADKTDWMIGELTSAWMNPPYSMTRAFLERAHRERHNGVTTVCLVPARTDTRYWHDYVPYANEVRFLKGRLKFLSGGLPADAAPFPSAVIVFRPGPRRVRPAPNMWLWDWRDEDD